MKNARYLHFFMTEAAQRPRHEMLVWESDWEITQRIGHETIIPDAFVIYGSESTELHAFVEIDLGTAADLQQAAELCDRVLTKIDILGAAQVLDDGYTSGQFDVPRERFSWEAEITPLDVGDLYDVIVTIRWETAFENRSVEMQTLLRDSSEDGPSLLHWEDL